MRLPPPTWLALSTAVRALAALAAGLVRSLRIIIDAARAAALLTGLTGSTMLRSVGLT